MLRGGVPKYMIDILELILDAFANALCLTLTNLPFVKTWQIPIPKNQLLAIRKAKIIMVNMMINGVINKKKLIRTCKISPMIT